MKSIPIKILVFFFSILFLSGCWDLSNTEEPTRFVGKVINKDTNQPIIDGLVYFWGYRLLPVNSIIEVKDSVEIDSEGNFDFTLRPDEEKIAFVDLNISIKTDSIRDFVHSTTGDLRIDCSPYNCRDFDTGNSYKFDIIVTVPQEE